MHHADAEDSTFKFLITTDNHLGFAERDPRRGDDSFTTFEEILRAARVEHDVDAMLLGGDLFHDNKPSLGCIVRTCSLLRKYVFGNKEIPFSLLSDPAVNFPTHALPIANYQDQNLNVALPIFSIHGNHDDPVGGTSSLDVLATGGFLNYFGHVPSLEDIVIQPILLRKGQTYVALYGLGNVRDERLHRCFALKKVEFVYPKPVAGRKWFCILVLHQNRGLRGAAGKRGILESMLAGFGMDLVIWGNEHEQMMVPQPSNGFDIVQPGSSILTSLSEQECNPKQYGIVEIRGTSYRLTPCRLRSVRPVVRRMVELREDLPDGRTMDAVETFLHHVVEEMIAEAEVQVQQIPDDVLAFHPNLKYPLMRLAVDFSDVTSVPFPQPNWNRFGQHYMEVVANPGELLRPVLPRRDRGAGTLGTSVGPRGPLVVPTVPLLHTFDIRAKVAEVFNSNIRDACVVMSESELSAAVYAFVEKGESNAIDERLQQLLHEAQKAVWRRMDNGNSDMILRPDKVIEALADHKRQVNDRYARALQAEMLEEQQQKGDADDGSQARNRATSSRQLDAFEVIRPPETVQSNASAPRAGGAYGAPLMGPQHPMTGDGESEGGGGSCHADLRSSSSLPVHRAMQLHGGTAEQPISSDSAPPHRMRADALGMPESDVLADDGEELPEDGLTRIPVDGIVARAFDDDDRDGSGGPTNRKRTRDGGGGGGSRSVGLQHASTAAVSPSAFVDVDGGNDGENESSNSTGMGMYKAHATATVAGGAGRSGSRRKSNAFAAPKASRGGGGRGGRGRSGGASSTMTGHDSERSNNTGPRLLLVPIQQQQRPSADASAAPQAAVTRSTATTRTTDQRDSAGGNAAVLNLLSKWSGSASQGA